MIEEGIGPTGATGQQCRKAQGDVAVSHFGQRDGVLSTSVSEGRFRLLASECVDRERQIPVKLHGVHGEIEVCIDNQHAAFYRKRTSSKGLSEKPLKIMPIRAVDSTLERDCLRVDFRCLSANRRIPSCFVAFEYDFHYHATDGPEITSGQQHDF